MSVKVTYVTDEGEGPYAFGTGVTLLSVVVDGQEIWSRPKKRVHPERPGRVFAAEVGDKDLYRWEGCPPTSGGAEVCALFPATYE